MWIHITLTTDRFITGNFYIVNIYVPLPLGLGLMEEYNFHVNTVENVICSPHLKVLTPILQNPGDIYPELNKEDKLTFMKRKLTKLHW